ncbi:Rrf2 family transcriptional regulator [Siccirubricoccus sp. KC 17139]|uniref:Rrf2 family transcriptional regulator n=1 Tax=Siccirubricoccus soli TaxID=2899147 RepID=A0ABT1CYE5_9PROT|nr:Rrf2 family transcriptional regulator [Siccirubricoccus soli]MCO6414678.1 Rrf2 family transcriptional regulator [Siccirubricoccus soli]MCP2680808.1 Rrf2 family transcriptional regulator [Siccirubricoccus soli]
MIATRYSVALHILLLIADEATGESTSARMAWSIGTNPVVVRRIAGQLSRAGLISVQRGPGGASLSRPAEQITLRDVWRAIHPERETMIRVHGRTNAACPIGAQVPALLRHRFDQAEQVMLEHFGATTLAELSAQLRRQKTEAA